MERTTLKQSAPMPLKPYQLAFSLLLLNPVAALVSAGNYLGGTLTAFDRGELSLPFVLAFLGTFAASALALVVLHRWGRDLPLRRTAWVSFFALAAGGGALAAGALATGAPLWLGASAVLSAAGTAALLYCWLTVCSTFPFRTALLWIAACLCLASVMSLAVLSTSDARIMMATTALSPCVAAAVLLASRGVRRSEARCETAAHREGQSEPLGAFFGGTWPIFVGALLCLFLLGLMWTEPEQALEFAHSAGITQGTFIGFIVAAVAVAAVAALYPNEKNLRAVCFSFAPIIITLPLAACILTVDPSGIVGYLLGGLTGIACSFFASLSFSIVLESEANWRVSLPTTWGCCGIAACLALATGIVVNQTIDPSQTMSVTLALFVAYLVALATRAVRSSARASAAQQAEAPVDVRQEECERIVRACGLSPREAEVLALLARGRSSTYIAQELYVSPETVKVHIKHIYEKTGVHSRQELLDLFE